MMRDENRVKKCEKYLILLNKLAGVVQWQNGSFPIFLRAFRTHTREPSGPGQKPILSIHRLSRGTGKPSP